MRCAIDSQHACVNSATVRGKAFASEHTVRHAAAAAAVDLGLYYSADATILGLLLLPGPLKRFFLGGGGANRLMCRVIGA